MLQLSFFLRIAIDLLLKDKSVVADTSICNTSSNGVVIPDYIPEIEGKALMKIYNTTVGLQLTGPEVHFNADTFREAALSYYQDISKTKLEGFLDLPKHSINHSKKQDYILVSYLVRYDLIDLLQSDDINDNLIESTIGNYDEVSYYIGCVYNQLTDFFTFTSKEDFYFEGASICNQIDCGAFMTCTETTDGISVCCQSICKFEYCKNNGTCIHERNISSPHCQCLALQSVSYSLWYYGEVCESVLTEWMIILAVVLPIIAIILATTFACCCYCTKYRKRKKQMISKLHLEFGATDNCSYISKEDYASNNNDTISKMPVKEKKNLYVNWNPKIREDYYTPNQDEALAQKQDTISSSSSSSENQKSEKQIGSDSWSLENQRTENLSTKDLEEIQGLKTQNTSNAVGKINISLRPGWTPSIGPQLLNTKNSNVLVIDSYL